MMPEMCPGGFEDTQTPEVNIYLNDGTLTGTMNGFPEIAPAAEVNDDELTGDIPSDWTAENTIEVRCSLKLPKAIKRMGICKSKKRFIKLMMSYGMPRNMAHELAKAPGYMGGMWSFQYWFNSVCRVESQRWRVFEL